MLKPLTSLRFVAAVLVYLWHVNVLTQYQTGYLGVSFFFVLSGFILTYTYKEKFSTIRNENLFHFYLARFAKIYPVHLLMFLLAVPIVILTSSTINLRLMIYGVINLSLMQSFTATPFTFNGVSWSISDEMFFYAVFPFVLYTLLRNPIFKKTFAIIAVMCVIWGVSNYVIGSYQAKIDDWVVYSFPPVRIIDFIMGVLLGLAFINHAPSSKESKPYTYTVLEMVTLLVLIGVVMYSPNVTQSLRFSVYFLPFWSLLIYVFALQRGYISRLLSNRLLVFLGEVSFSFYMVHGLVLRYLNYWLIPNADYVGFIVSLLLSSVVFVFYEEKLRKLIRHRLSVKRTDRTKQPAINA